MSSDPETPKPFPSQSSPAPASDPDAGKSALQRLSWKAYAVGILALLLIIFVAQNSQKVEVDFIVSTTTTPLIFALLIATAFGAAIGWLIPRIIRGGRGGRADD